MNDQPKPINEPESELLGRLSTESPWLQCLGVNICQLKAALETPFIFVVAVNPEDGSFQIASQSDRQDVADMMTQEFGAIMEEKIVPMAKTNISPAAEPSRLLRPDGRPFMIPGAPPEPKPIGKVKRPPRKAPKR